MKKTFWKAADPNGWDFHTGKTINYRENVGKTVSVPQEDRWKKPELCSSTVLHAAKLPNNVFVSAKIPMSLYEVAGKPVVEDDSKCGFRSLKVLREIPQDKIADVLGWNYAEACNPVDPLKTSRSKITPQLFEALKYWDQVWAQVRAQVRTPIWAQVRAQVWDQVRAPIWDQVRAQVWDQVWAQVGAQVRAQVGAQVRAQVRAPIWAQVRDQVYGYISSLFPRKISPSCDVLWRAGFLWTFYDGLWRLRGGPEAKVVWQGKLEELKPK